MGLTPQVDEEMTGIVIEIQTGESGVQEMPDRVMRKGRFVTVSELRNRRRVPDPPREPTRRNALLPPHRGSCTKITLRPKGGPNERCSKIHGQGRHLVETSLHDAEIMHRMNRRACRRDASSRRHGQGAETLNRRDVHDDQRSLLRHYRGFVGSFVTCSEQHTMQTSSIPMGGCGLEISLRRTPGLLT